MKPAAYLINTARGGIVDEDALYEALKNRRHRRRGDRLFRAGAGHRAAPLRRSGQRSPGAAQHRVDQRIFRDIGRAVVPGHGRPFAGPAAQGAVNPEVFDRPGFQAKWKSCASARDCTRNTAIRGISHEQRRLEGQVAWISGATSGIGGGGGRPVRPGRRRGGAHRAAASSMSRAIAARNPGRRRRSPGHRLRCQPRGPGARLHRGRPPAASADWTFLSTMPAWSRSSSSTSTREAEWDWSDGRQREIDVLRHQARHGPPAQERTQLHRQRGLDQQLCRPGLDAGLYHLEARRARADPIHRPGLRGRRRSLQLRLPGNHRHADAPRTSERPPIPRPRWPAGCAAWRWAWRSSPLDVARSILFFSCEDSSGVTGTSLTIDCGYLTAAEWETTRQNRFHGADDATETRLCRLCLSPAAARPGPRPDRDAPISTASTSACSRAARTSGRRASLPTRAGPPPLAGSWPIGGCGRPTCFCKPTRTSCPMRSIIRRPPGGDRHAAGS